MILITQIIGTNTKTNEIKKEKLLLDLTWFYFYNTKNRMTRTSPTRQTDGTLTTAPVQLMQNGPASELHNIRGLASDVLNKSEKCRHRHRERRVARTRMETHLVVCREISGITIDEVANDWPGHRWRRFRTCSRRCSTSRRYHPPIVQQPERRYRPGNEIESLPQQVKTCKT